MRKQSLKTGYLFIFQGCFIVFLFLQPIVTGAQQFTRITGGPQVTDGGWSFSVSWIDYDNDGFPDLHINNWVYGSNEAVNHLYHNDGDLDLFVANVNDVNNALYLNNGNDNAWIQITLI